MFDPNLAIMLVCKAFYTKMWMFIECGVYCISGSNKGKKKNMREISLHIDMIFSCGFIVFVWRKAIAALSYFSRDFWRDLEIVPLLLESCLMISLRISLSYFLLIYVLILTYKKDCCSIYPYYSLDWVPEKIYVKALILSTSEYALVWK